MHRCYIDSSKWGQAQIKLSPDEAHHLFHVMRASAGDEVELFDGTGAVSFARVVSPSQSIIEPLGEVKHHKRTVSISIIQAIPKGSRMDLIIEKGTELGVSAIYPVLTEHVITKIDLKKNNTSKSERWQKKALSAARQCGTAWVPEIKHVSDYSSALDACRSSDLFLLGSLEARARSFHDVIDEARNRDISSIAIIIGPEGDLASAESEQAVKMGAIPVTFGALVFRVETAALYAAAVLGYEFL